MEAFRSLSLKEGDAGAENLNGDYHVSKALFIDLNSHSVPQETLLKNYALEIYNIKHVRSIKNSPGNEENYDALKWLLADGDSDTTLLLHVLGSDQETNDLFAMDPKVKAIIAESLQKGTYLFVIFDNFQIEGIWDLRFQYLVDANGDISRQVLGETESLQSEGNIFVLGTFGGLQSSQHLSRALLSAFEILPDGKTADLLKFLGDFMLGTAFPILLTLHDFDPMEVKFNISQDIETHEPSGPLSAKHDFSKALFIGDSMLDSYLTDRYSIEFTRSIGSCSCSESVITEIQWLVENSCEDSCLFLHLAGMQLQSNRIERFRADLKHCFDSLPSGCFMIVVIDNPEHDVVDLPYTYKHQANSIILEGPQQKETNLSGFILALTLSNQQENYSGEVALSSMLVQVMERLENGTFAEILKGCSDIFGESASPLLKSSHHVDPSDIVFNLTEISSVIVNNSVSMKSKPSLDFAKALFVGKNQEKFGAFEELCDYVKTTYDIGDLQTIDSITPKGLNVLVEDATAGSSMLLLCNGKDTSGINREELTKVFSKLPEESICIGVFDGSYPTVDLSYNYSVNRHGDIKVSMSLKDLRPAQLTSLDQGNVTAGLFLAICGTGVSDAIMKLFQSGNNGSVAELLVFLDKHAENVSLTSSSLFDPEDMRFSLEDTQS